MSICSVGFWISRGYEKNYAVERIAKHQQKSSRKSNAVFTREYWKSQGFSESEIDDKIKESKTQRSSFTVDFWIAKGFTEDEANRKVYDIANSHLTHDITENAACECTEAEEVVEVADSTFLFTTATCPNCKIACSLLDKAGVAYEKLLANEHVDLVNEFGIKQAPTLVVVKDGVVSKFAGVSDIKKFLNV